jgi:uncharacterized protein (UPF0332 family)
MAKWHELAQDSLAAAGELTRSGRHRSAVSRAYYAAFAAATMRLHSAGVPFPADWDGPAHRDLPRLIEMNLPRPDLGKRRKLKQLVQNLYNTRISADYKPGHSIGSVEARSAVNYAGMVLKSLEVNHG